MENSLEFAQQQVDRDPYTGQLRDDVARLLAKYRYYRNNSARITWEESVREDEQFRNNVMWTSDDIEELERKGEAPISVNIVHPALETGVSILTMNNPRFTAVGIDDSDTKIAKLMTDIAEYVLRFNDFKKLNKKFVNDYYEKSIGILQVYPDVHEDGAGEIKIVNLYPLDVIPDPYSRDPGWEDADCIYVHKVLSKERLQFLYPGPKFRKVIDGAKSYTETTDYPATDREATEGQQFIGDYSTMDVDLYDLIEEYKKIKVVNYKITEDWSNKEYKMTEDQFNKYMQKRMVTVKTRESEEIVDNPSSIAQIEELRSKYGDTIVTVPGHGFAPFTGEIPQGGELLQFEDITAVQLLEEGRITAQEYYETRVMVTSVVGQSLLYKEVLPISLYPIVVVPNRHTDTPYPLSDVRMVKGMQEALNVITRLIILWTTNAAGMKVLVPENSVDDIDAFREDWSKTNAVVSFDAAEGHPVIAQPPQLPGEIVTMPDRLKSYIEYEFGLFPLMQGNPQGAPRTVGGTMAIEEFGQRRLKGKLQDLEAGWRKLGKLIFQYIPYVFTKRRIIRIAQPGEEPKEFVINDVRYDRYTNEIIERIADVRDTALQFDVDVVTGSTLPANKWAQYQAYVDAYKINLIDRYEALKKSQVFDVEGVMKRTGEVQKMKEMLQQMDQTIKDLQKELKRKTTEVQNAKERLELAKFTANLQSTEATVAAESRKSAELFAQTLTNEKEKMLQSLQKEANVPVRSTKEKK